MSRILAVFDPTTLPMAMAGAPSSAALSDTSNSGIEVPKPTTVSPISNGGMPSLLASEIAPRTRKSAPNVSKASPARSVNTFKSMIGVHGTRNRTRQDRRDGWAACVVG